MMFPVITGLEEFLRAKGVGTDAGVVLDHSSNANRLYGATGSLSNVVRPYPLWPIALRGDAHPTTRDLSNLSAGWATALTVTDSSSTASFGSLPKREPSKPRAESSCPTRFWIPIRTTSRLLTLAVALDPSAAGNGESSGEGDGSATEGRMVVVGDVDFLQEQFLRANPQNLVFTLNAIDWLAQDEALIGIRSKLRTPPVMAFTSEFQRGALKWGNLVGVPLAL